MRITARGPAVGAAALAMVLLAAVAGCSSGSDDGDSGSQLLTGLGTLAGDSDTKQVTYLDAAAVQKLGKGDSSRFASIAQPSSFMISSDGSRLLGQSFRVTQIDTAVDTNEAGHWEGSFDASAITKSLKSNGYAQSEKNGEEVWTQKGTGPSFQVSDDEISYSGRGSDPMSAVDPEDGSSLADDEQFRRAAECLGDVYRADFNPMSSPNPVRLASLGQQASSAAKNTEVLCFVVKDDATAQEMKSRLEAAVSAEAPKFDGTKVTVEKGDQPVVRAVVPDTAEQRPGRLVISDMELWMTAATDQ
ncbi:hypothetical protein ACIRD6_33830 [Streptomyces sp. NPDC102473]|uniref:hypothetical protein n=1 Tax=Streptomyces sp. NPDC102473 TaxID=3366180 RepID=UPI0037F28059